MLTLKLIDNYSPAWENFPAFFLPHRTPRPQANFTRAIYRHVAKEDWLQSNHTVRAFFTLSASFWNLRILWCQIERRPRRPNDTGRRLCLSCLLQLCCYRSPQLWPFWMTFCIRKTKLHFHIPDQECSWHFCFLPFFWGPHKSRPSIFRLWASRLLLGGKLSYRPDTKLWRLFSCTLVWFFCLFFIGKIQRACDVCIFIRRHRWN